MAPNRIREQHGWLLVAILLAYAPASGQTMYKYRGADGEWIYSDRPPADPEQAETRTLSARFSQPELTVTDTFVGDGIELVASNRYHAPMEVVLEFDQVQGVEYPHPDNPLRWLVPPRSELSLLRLATLGSLVAPAVDYRFEYFPGDPAAQHDDRQLYRVPFAVGTEHAVSQAYPVSMTHGTQDSMHAVDFDMPVGTNVVAARDGTVFNVVSSNFRGGADRGRFARLANVVYVLHDDDTFAVYAHLNWNTIRVKPGDRVSAGQYIADSGNTGFTTGPHLHFAVQRNAGRRIESLQVAFRGVDGMAVRPSTGDRLTAYP